MAADEDWQMSKLWRVPWTEVRYETKYEADDECYNCDWAFTLLNDFDLWEDMLADPAERHAQGMALMDDVVIAFDMLGWKVVCKDDPERRFPITRNDGFAPDWCEVD
jgi:hypothetical protein